MGHDERPEDERGLPQTDEPEPEANVREAGEEPPRHRARRALLVFAGALIVSMLLVGWNRLVTSDAFCASCHEMEPAADAGSRSVHDDVSCLACHTKPGLAGSLRYLPTFARESIQTFTGWDIANGVLAARDCGSCHVAIAGTPELEAAHPEGADCAACHGEVSHPPLRLAGFERPVEAVAGEDPHPPAYVQTHGEAVVGGLGTCVECHDAGFCEACHFRSTYPHPRGWIGEHGPTQMAEGPDACTLCHPQTFCAGCHGTEIPHRLGWLGEHWRDLQDAPVAPCMLCHPKTDCTSCHTVHNVHREQDLYTEPPT